MIASSVALEDNDGESARPPAHAFLRSSCLRFPPCAHPGLLIVMNANMIQTFLRSRYVARWLRVACRVVMLAIAGNLPQLRAADTSDATAFFENKIRPLLVRHCYECHGPDEAESQLRLDTRAGWEKGGDRGPAIVPGDPSSSLLVRAVTGQDPELAMPPKDTGDTLQPSEIEDLVTWIRHGAMDPRDGEVVVSDRERAARTHWAFQPLAPPPQVRQFLTGSLPTVDQLALLARAEVPHETSQHPIDRIVDDKLKERGLTPTDRSDYRALVRRVTLDLTGLPPTWEQWQSTPDTWPQLIRQLLASPAYAERWARHWLDVARYSDAKDGVLMYGDARIRPFAYTYRDYVIRAFRDDKPFDQFIREQLAADRLAIPADSPDRAALGLLTLGRMFDGNRHDIIDDQIDVVARGFLGLTVSCARCHDHKFDPIPTADYYSLYGVFASCIEPYERPRIEEVDAAGQPFEEEFAAKLKQVYEQQATHYAETLKIARERTADYLVHVATTEPDVAETTIFFLSLTPDQLRPQITKRWRQLIARRAFADDTIFGPWHDFARNNTVQPETWRARGVDARIVAGIVQANPSSMESLARAYGQIIIEAWSSAMAQGGEAAAEQDPIASLLVSRSGPLWFPPRDVASYLSRQPGDAYRGLLGELDAIAVKHRDAAARAMVVEDSETLCDPVIFQRGDPSMRGSPVPRQFLGILSPPTRTPFTDGAGRLDLAAAIASPTNPLTARVWVNRVWMHHLGEPLVENPSDFGLQTKRPEQLELLDFLAAYFQHSGWRTKALHELIVTSRVYQRSSVLPTHHAMAQQSQTDPSNQYLWRANRRRLDLEQMRDSLLSVSGELDTTPFGRPTVMTDPTNLRRSIYAFVERQNIPAMVQTFDFANADTSTARRPLTTVPQQALFAMNSPFMLARCKALAARAEATGNDERVPSLFAWAFGRKPTDEERAECDAFLQQGSLEQLAQVLLMSNEWMFVD